MNKGGGDSGSKSEEVRLNLASVVEIVWMEQKSEKRNAIAVPSVHRGTYDLERKTFQSKELNWDYGHYTGKWEKVVVTIMETKAVGARET